MAQDECLSYNPCMADTMHDTDDEFTVTEAGMRAVVETMYSLHQAVAVLQAQMEAAAEAMAMLSVRADLLEANASRGYIPAGY